MNKDKVLNILIEAQDKASAVIESVGSRTEAVSKKVAGVAATAAKAAAAAATVATGAFITQGIRFNSSVEQAQATIQAFTKDSAKTAEILKYVKEESLRTQFGFVDMANAASGLIPASKSSGVALEELIKQAEILGALNPAEGLEGGAFALKEALSGDFTSIVERFNLPRKRLNELKDEGVPALEAIRTALSEMGIDYSLVAAQGQTAGARWDTMKDQFTQFAGVVTKPIFDKLSEGLAKTSSSIDWNAWGANATNTLSALGSWFNRTVTSLQPVFHWVAEMLGPSLQTLWQTFQERLLPALSRFIPFLQFGAAVIGATLVVSLWLLINVLNIVASTLGWVGQVVANTGQWFVDRWNNIKSLWSQAPGFFRNIGESISNAFSRVKDYITGAFSGAYEAVKGLPSKMVALFSNIGPSIRKVIGDIDIPGPLGKVKDTIPGFASGGYTGAGPANEVAGVVHKGEYVVPKRQVNQATGQPYTNNATTTIGTVVLQSSAAVQEFFKQIDADSVLASKGFATARGY